MCSPHFKCSARNGEVCKHDVKMLEAVLGWLVWLGIWIGLWVGSASKNDKDNGRENDGRAASRRQNELRQVSRQFVST